MSLKKHFILPLVVFCFAIGSFLIYLLLPKTFAQCVNFPGSIYTKSHTTCYTFYKQEFKNPRPPSFDP
ncbi:hypothetical protein A2397_05785 [Candidatus Amesbacteria bacterium RIFOXYB1_FULL_44_23]|uniref:Uncharacterized protein n=1 Tax=Candidatus Amesbacteria bacterium RIFOXYB1_FULL_44_23 TaxID=1797263 RepID=A0A1F4ZU40_9BACT|nr:MAG: hypothetical protein A2397_05785 [Candidatus Amesbacteria bacterium RIFOXYB1_FULL_44_23]